MMNCQTSPGWKTPSFAMLSLNNGLFRSDGLRSILNANWLLTIPSMLLNFVPGLATYQTLSHGMPVKFIMRTSELTEPAGAELGQAKIEIGPGKPESMRSLDGKTCRPSSSTWTGTLSTSQPGVSMELTSVG